MLPPNQTTGPQTRPGIVVDGPDGPLTGPGGVVDGPDAPVTGPNVVVDGPDAPRMGGVMDAPDAPDAPQAGPRDGPETVAAAPDAADAVDTGSADGPDTPQRDLVTSSESEQYGIVGQGQWDRSIHDDNYTTSRHTITGSKVRRDLRRGREAHIFNEDIDLVTLEQKVWTEGNYQGIVRDWHRFVYHSDIPVGRRIQSGRADVPLRVVEIKGRQRADGVWEYHMVPRARPAE